MFFTANQVRTLTEQKLVEFLDRRISESTGVIDYKSDLSGGKGPDRANLELLKDVSAFANAEGGHLLMGMSEPTRENDGAAFLGGIEGGEQAATKIEERCAQCIDPRIPGLLACAIPLANGKSAVVVHVPPSPSRPHMVIYEGTKTRAFFIRHSETAQPMKSSEVRHAVLSAAAGHHDAVEYAAQQEERYKELYIKNRCAFLLHATPLVPVEVLWEVTGNKWVQVLDGSYRRKHFVNLDGNFRQPSIEGVVCVNRDQDPFVFFEVHRTGYVGATEIVTPLERSNDIKGPYFWGSHTDLFLAFAELCAEAVETAQSDRPYLLQAAITNSAGAVLEYGAPNYSAYFSKPLQRNWLQFPHLRRDSGQSFLEAVQPWKPIFYNAFGINYRPEYK